MGRSRILPATALDTNVLIAGLLSWHQHHAAASAALSELLESRASVVLPAHALVEAYAVMTRIPPPHRLSAKNAFEILDASLRSRCVLVSLEGSEAWDLIDELSRRPITGGSSYDALILACARKGGARRILTFNRVHFERLGAEDIEVVVPGSE